MIQTENFKKFPTDILDDESNYICNEKVIINKPFGITFGTRTPFNSQPKMIRHFTESERIPTKITSNFNLTKTIEDIKNTSNNTQRNINKLSINKINKIDKENQSNNINKTNLLKTENIDSLKREKNPISIFQNANLEKVKISHKSFGLIHSYGAITSEGRRDYNEDRVSIIYNISKPINFIETQNNKWPKCSFFGLYDGHGGRGCCDYLRDNLHKFIINDINFPNNPQKSIVNGFIKAEKNFLKEYGIKDSSGSCAIVLLIIEKRCYIANVGDSRAILSGHNGLKTYILSRDHRPGDEKEYKRILDAGGKIYQTEYENVYNGNSNTHIIGPLRVFPGKLSVSRTLGDFEAKDPNFGGNPNVIISTPEIKYFDINDKNDFILIGCDGIFEKMKNKFVINSVWDVIKKFNFKDIHNLTGVCIEKIMNLCIEKESLDNLTLIMISLKSLGELKRNKFIDYIPSQTENVILSKQRLQSAIPRTLKNKNNNNKQSLSFLLTKLVHNSSSNIKKVVNNHSKKLK